jgi:hypothetical protein
MATCWLAAIDGVLLEGEILSAVGNKSFGYVTVDGTTSTQIVLAPASYAYKFNVSKGTKFSITVYADGQAVDCDPSSFETSDGGGPIGRVTLFKVG